MNVTGAENEDAFMPVEMLPEGSTDAMQRVLDSLEGYVRELAGSWVSIDRWDYYEGAIGMVEVRPENPHAAGLLIVGQRWLEVEVGGRGATWLLGYSDANLRQARQIIEAVIHGRVIERVDRSRSEVVVTLPAGAELTETGIGTGRGRSDLIQTVAWQPYQPPTTPG